MGHLVDIHCACGRVLHVRSADAGRRIRCIACGQELVVPPIQHPSRRRAIVAGAVSLALIASGITLIAVSESRPAPSPLPEPPASVATVAPRLARQIALAPLVPRDLADSVGRGWISCTDLRRAGLVTRPRSGYELGRGQHADANELVVKNSSGRDAVVRIRRPSMRSVVRTAFVRTETVSTISRIPDGTYEVLFMFGEDWVPRLGRFCTGPSYSRFDDLFEFDPAYDRYVSWEVTLHPVVGGTAETSPVDPAAFEDIPQ